MKLSIVATLYCSAQYVVEFCQRVSVIARNLVGEDFEIILVNDGSPDDSLNIAVELTRSNSQLVVIDLSRNFGHHKAMMAGLEFANGDLIYLIDIDLEEKPEWLGPFYAQIYADGADVVFGTQAERRGGLGERLSGYLFYRLFRLLTDIKQPNNITTARLMTKRYVESLLLHKEAEINIGGLWIITGFKQTTQIVKKNSTSPTTYNLSRKFSHFVNAITSFSSFPLILIFYSGVLISITAVIFISFLMLRYFITSSIPQGYTSLIASIWLFSGLIVLFLGIQGVYLSKIYIEVKRRPNTIVRQVYGKKSKYEVKNVY